MESNKITDRVTSAVQQSVETSKTAVNSISRRLSGTHTISKNITTNGTINGTLKVRWTKTMKHPYIANAANIMWSMPFQFLCFALLCCTFTIIPVILCGLAAYSIVYVYRLLLLTYNHRKFLPVSRDHWAVLITGCSSGIGYDAALRLAGLGFTVFATVRRNEDKEHLIKSFKTSQESKQAAGTHIASGTLVPLILEVTSTDQIKQCVKEVEDYINKSMAKDARLVAVINNASYGDYAPIELMKPEQLRAQFDVNVISYVTICQAFLPLLRKNNNQPSGKQPKHKSRLIFVVSGLSKFSMAGTAAYTASKHALDAIVDCFRAELRKWDIDTIGICPGLIDTPFHPKANERRTSTIKAAERGEREFGETAHATKSAAELPKSKPHEIVQQYATATRIANIKERLAGKSVNSPAFVADVIQTTVFDPRPLPYYFAGLDVAFWPLEAHLPQQCVDWIYGTEYMIDWTKWGNVLNKLKQKKL